MFPEVHGKDEYLQAVQVLAPRFRFFGTFIPGNENAARSAICIHKDLLPEDASVTHTVWATKSSDCQRPFRTGAFLEAFR